MRAEAEQWATTVDARADRADASAAGRDPAARRSIRWRDEAKPRCVARRSSLARGDRCRRPQDRAVAPRDERTPDLRQVARLPREGQAVPAHPDGGRGRTRRVRRPTWARRKRCSSRTRRSSSRRRTTTDMRPSGESQGDRRARARELDHRVVAVEGAEARAPGVRRAGEARSSAAPTASARTSSPPGRSEGRRPAGSGRAHPRAARRRRPRPERLRGRRTRRS